MTMLQWCNAANYEGTCNQD